MNKSMKHIVIIGNGISGVTAARNIRKSSSHKITIISAESDHFFSRTALMYIFMGHMRYEDTKVYEDGFWEKNDINLLNGLVTKVDSENKKLALSNGSTIDYDQLILAVGSTPNKFGWPGQDIPGVQGLYSLQDVYLMQERSNNIRQAVIVGGGLIGIEMAEMLLSKNIHVTFLVREKYYWSKVLPLEEGNIITRHIREHHVDLRFEEELKEIVPDDSGHVRRIITVNNEEIQCQFVGLTVGVRPNMDFLENSPIETDRGILVNEYFETNVPDIFSIGDCAQFKTPPPDRKPIEQVWYTGRMHGETLAKTLCGERSKYAPGNWFNSAKFFDIEYQTYGIVTPTISEQERTIYWEHPDGKKCCRINYRKEDEIVTGFNLLGIRFRHEVCDRWLNEKRTITYVLDNLRTANFDPEFFRHYEIDIIRQYAE